MVDLLSQIEGVRFYASDMDFVLLALCPEFSEAARAYQIGRGPPLQRLVDREGLLRIDEKLARLVALLALTADAIQDAASEQGLPIRGAVQQLTDQLRSLPMPDAALLPSTEVPVAVAEPKGIPETLGAFTAPQIELVLTSRFEPLGEKVVHDREHSLLWWYGVASPLTWAEAKASASGGYHLPTQAELKSLFAAERAEAEAAFGGSLAGWFWSSEPDWSDLRLVWCAAFGSNNQTLLRDARARVLLVREASNRQGE